MKQKKTNSNQNSSETQGDYKIWITNPAWMKWSSCSTPEK
jgi:outer membrane lipoprotein-sorting protein